MTRKSTNAKTPFETKPLQTSHDDQGAPIEHFRGERHCQETTGDSGDIDEETLDRDAPYNKP